MNPFHRKRDKQPTEPRESNSKRAKHGPNAGSRGESGTVGPSTSPSSQPHTGSYAEPPNIAPIAESRKRQIPGPASPMQEDIPGETLSNTDSLAAPQTTQGVLSNFTRSMESNLPREAAPAQTPHTDQGGTSIKWKPWKGFAKPIGNVLGPIKELAEIFGQCVDTHQMAGQANLEYEQLQSRIQTLFEDLMTYFEEGCSPTMTLSMENLRESIRAELDYIQQKQGRNREHRYREAEQDAEDIVACYRRMEGYLNRLLLNANLSTWRIVHEQAAHSRSDHVFSLVDRLPSSMPAWYNSAEGAALRRRECTPGTRVDVIAGILGWVHNMGKGGVYWLNGMAGTGKTTIAYSVCLGLNSRYRLGASFFCSRLREECRNVKLIIPSIAYQLARFSHPFRSAVCAVLKRDPDVHGRRLELQFDALIKEPMLAVQHTLPEELVVVIDALDECEDKGSTRKILEVLLKEANSLPIRFIISSRPEPQIRDQINVATARLVLHELDQGVVGADIKKYLREGLARMNPSEGQIDALAERAGILFIHAATVVRYISYDNFNRNPTARLRTILNKKQERETMESKEIDRLYLTILEAAFDDPEIDETERVDMEQVLHTVICAREPLTVDGLSELLGIGDGDRVRAALRPMWSVLHVVETNELVTTLHASFPDFMFSSARSKTRCCDFRAFNSQLADHCFNRIRETPTDFNICRLGSSYLLDKEVPDIEERIEAAIPAELRYACRYWADHVKAGECATNVVKHILDLLSIKLMMWIEVLNLNKQIKAGTESMRLTVEWCKVAKDDRELIELANDAKRFVDTFASNPVSQSTPHIYVSMLAFWPKSSPISKYYAKYTKGPVMPEGTALDQRQLAHLSTWAFESGVRAMAVSPDGLLLALGVGKKVVVLDSSSGRELLHRLKGHQNGVRSVAFSLDGSRIFSGSINDSDAMVLAWDTRSGDAVFGPVQLQGHTDVINCLGFSPDCTRVITGSNDCTVRLWNSETGAAVSRLTAQSQSWDMTAVFTPNGNRILATLWNGTVLTWDAQDNDTNLYEVTEIDQASGVIFSPDESRIISYYEARISIWDAQSHEKILGLDEGHKDHITCIGCSPDGKYIVSGSADRTVCVWDAQTGNIVLGPLQAHTGDITSVAFTPDGSRIISACTGGLVCTWDAQHRTLTPSSTNPPFHPIRCVKFSSDGTRFVSGSVEGTISIWDAHTGEMRVGPIKAHTSYIYAVDFLNDRVVSGAKDGTIRACDALTGEVVLGPLRLDAETIYAIRYSPDGQMIATGSDSRVDVWNGQNGNRVLGPLTGLDRPVVCVQFSPDGTRILASALAFSSNIAVWDISTGQLLFGTLDAHRRYVCSVSYSPNGALIASGSYDRTIIVWDAYTGEKRLGPLTAHSSVVLSVHFSPDSTRLVSGSSDRRIRMWDVETGEMVFELLNGHEGWITSVEYSPDGTRILSRSDDESVRIHDARSPAERALSRSEWEIGDWTINKDGWVVDDQSRLLVWVPGDLRKALMWPRTQVVVIPQGYVRLKFDKSRLGESWAEGYKPGM